MAEKQTCAEQLDEVDAALIDIISGILHNEELPDSVPSELLGEILDLSKERCYEILRLYGIVSDRYEKRHKISK
jgi:hypothetical protein